ncbi:cell division protein FtsZ [Muribaculum gordoncarteri]|jgi:cell division protein FtsZ|uniref:Cell division protein FtsZ n=2 Tax=Muribaculum TaxID=1918540 RepID=A0A4P7VR64_9BACT|nr:cell division protein FtsZ [Muribaculum gordoncarteri]QCD36829.1 cell division protein FtsZ [Muribaculum gordoncarteri]
MAPEDIPAPNEIGFTDREPTDDIIKVIGVGGGGNNAVSHMYEQGIKNVSFVICNTDRQALKNSPVPTRVEIGNGLGAGNKPEIAREAAEAAVDKINQLFDDHTKMVFITAGMGGGTGTGAAPVVARLAKEHGLLTIGIVTIPFLFEGERKILKALNGADEMSKYVDALLVINNQRLTDIYPDLNFVNAFGKADDTLTTAARSISELITCDGKINLDFNDVDTTLRDGGAAIISTGYGEGEQRVTKAIDDALNSPLLKNRDILTSKKLLFNIYFSPEAEQEFKMEETEELTSFISSIDSDVDVIWGASYDRTLGDKVKITILAAGFDVTIDESKSRGTRSRVVNFNRNKKEEEHDATQRLGDEYGKEAVLRMQGDKAKARYIVLTPSQMDDERSIEAIEKSPTYNRDKKTSDEIKEMGKSSSGNADEPRPNNAASNNSGFSIQF